MGEVGLCVNNDDDDNVLLKVDSIAEYGGDWKLVFDT